MDWSEIDVNKTVSDICDVLPDDDAKGFSLLMATAAIWAVEAGFEDDAALASLLASLREVRAKSEIGVH